MSNWFIIRTSSSEYIESEDPEFLIRLAVTRFVYKMWEDDDLIPTECSITIKYEEGLDTLYRVNLTAIHPRTGVRRIVDTISIFKEKEEPENDEQKETSDREAR